MYDSSAADGQYYYVTDKKQLEGRVYDHDAEGSRIGEADMLLSLDTPYSGLALDGNRLYFNDNKTISYIDVTEEDCGSVVRYALAEEEQDNIYGFTKDNNTIYYAKGLLITYRETARSIPLTNLRPVPSRFRRETAQSLKHAASRREVMRHRLTGWKSPKGMSFQAGRGTTAM